MAHSYDENKTRIMSVIKGIRPKSILDVGIGAGDYGQLIKESLPDSLLMGIDSHTGYAGEKWKYYDSLAIRDMRDCEFPPVDLIMFIDSLEHINHEEAMAVLNRIECDILLSIPRDYKQENADFWDRHRSKWVKNDFIAFDYEDYSNELSIILLIKKGDK